MLRKFTEQLQSTRADLTVDEIRAVVPALLSTDHANDEKAAFLLALRRKGEVASEISAFVEALLERAVDPGIDPATLGGPLIDPCGTGGDSLDLFNVSTAAMFLLAAGGACVIKHGNRAITSRSGGADVLEELGLPIRLPPAELRESLRRHGFGFAFAPDYHPAFQAIAPVRRLLAERGERSVFNLLGPLLNPARPAYQLTGVFAPELVPVFAEVLAKLGRIRAWALHGRVDAARGMDEISPVGATSLGRCEGVVVTHGHIDPSEFGLPAAGSIEALRGGGPPENARIILGILRGEITDARRDFVLMNAAAGFVVAGLAPSLARGVELGLAQIADGRALAKLEAARSA
jgi:anthranilate phosphoribosyltransferase